VVLDAGTLVAALVVVCVALACLLVITWAQSRGEPALATWVFCFALAAVAAVIAAVRDWLPGSVGVETSIALRLFALGLAWRGARQFAGQKANWVLVCAPAFVWLAAAGALSAFDGDERLRVVVEAPLVAAYSLAIGAELWRVDTRLLWFARAAAVVLWAHGLFSLTRFFTALTLSGAELQASIGYPLHPITVLEKLTVAVALAFVLLSAARDQASLHYMRDALLDPLTGVSNRRGFEAEVTRMLARARRNSSPTALLLLDLDHLKQVNDGVGHLAGDRALQELANAVGATLRAGDLLGRLGGDEFAVAAAECRLDQAFDLARRIRGVASALVVRHGSDELRLSVSIGVASLHEADSLEELVKQADTALYRAKWGGRDRIEVALERLPDAAHDRLREAEWRVA
jgi:diguanylate cyclase (GGDEF)-like protein